MQNGVTRWVFLFLVLLLWSDSIAGKARSGSVRDDVYTSPDKSFQFKIPTLISPGTFINDVRETETSFKVLMGDELCRRIFVIQHVKHSYADFESFFSGRKSMMQIVDIESRESTVPQGYAIWVTGGMPHAPVCSVMTFGEGGKLVPGEGPGSDVGIVFLETKDAFYEFGYIVDEDRTFTGMYGVSNIEEVLEKLFTSFKVIGPRAVAKLPAIAPLVRFIDKESVGHCEALGPIKGKSTSFAASVDQHMTRAKSKLREEAERLGANAIMIRNSKVKTSLLTGYPYMQLVGDALVCDNVPAYTAWEIRAAK